MISTAENDQELANVVALLDIGALVQNIGFIVVPVFLSVVPLYGARLT